MTDSLPDQQAARSDPDAVPSPAPPAPSGVGEAAPGPTTAELERVLYDAMSGTAVRLLGMPNVVMQLSRLPVGHGVAKSKVDSGRLDLHPLKRTRTTIAYLAIAMFGTEQERVAYRREVNRQHRQVRSEPSDEVQYNAFDPDLQLWVAACIFVGAEQAIELHDPDLLDAPGYREAFYRHGARFGTTLQVPEEMWPADREAFERYWREGLERIEMDDVTRGFLQHLVTLGFLPAPIHRVFGRAYRFLVTGYLPTPFREELGLPWGSRRQAVHDRATRVAMAVSRITPGPLRRFPINAYLWDTRRRIRSGKPIV